MPSEHATRSDASMLQACGTAILTFCMGRWSRHGQVLGRVVFFLFSENTGNVPGGNKLLEMPSQQADRLSVSTVHPLAGRPERFGKCRLSSMSVDVY